MGNVPGTPVPAPTSYRTPCNPSKPSLPPCTDCIAPGDTDITTRVRTRITTRKTLISLRTLYACTSWNTLIAFDSRTYSRSSCSSVVPKHAFYCSIRERWIRSVVSIDEIEYERGTEHERILIVPFVPGD